VCEKCGLAALTVNTVPAQDWLESLLLDPALRASGIDPASDSASLAKGFGMTWLNPQATDEQIHADLERIREYASGSEQEDELRAIHQDSSLTDVQRRERIISVLDDILPSRYELASDLVAEYSGGVRIGMTMPEARRRVNQMGITGSRDEGRSGYTGYVAHQWMVTALPGSNGVNRIDYTHWGRADGYAVFESVLYRANELLGPPDSTRGGGDHATWNIDQDGKNFWFSVVWVPTGEPYAGIQIGERRN
jgi:hypothetical protein